MATSKKPAAAKNFANSLSTNNLIALCLLAAVITVVITLVVGRILVGDLSHNAHVLTKKTAASKQINQNYNNLKNLQSQYDSLGAVRDTVGTALPTQPSLPALWSMMENIGNASGVSTQSVSSAVTSDVAATASSSPTEVKFTVAVQGSYTALQSYLANMEASARPLRVNNVTLSGSNTQLQANFDVSTYYQGPADISIGSETIQ